MALGVKLGEVVECHCVADSGNDVFALGTRQVVPICHTSARRRVTGEGHTSSRVLVEIAEHHHLDIGGGAERIGDAVDPSVFDGSFVAPGVENGAD